jgi:hypothetical protein
VKVLLHEEEFRSPAGRPDFKSGKGCRTVLGGFDSHTLPPIIEWEVFAWLKCEAVYFLMICFMTQSLTFG